LGAEVIEKRNGLRAKVTKNNERMLEQKQASDIGALPATGAEQFWPGGF
jgi:hypothetical protein